MNRQDEHTRGYYEEVLEPQSAVVRVDSFLPRVRFQLRTFYLLGTRIDNIHGDLARHIIGQYVETDQSVQRARKVFFVNVHSICMAQKNEILKPCIELGDLVLSDGSGVKIGGKVMGHPVLENLNGTDFTPTILKLAEERKWSVFLLGARQEVVEKCAERIRTSYPNLRLLGFRNGFFRRDDRGVVAEINALRPDILLVALGTPLQELWITQHAPELNVKVCMAVGGLFDFLSLTRKRAPVWMRRLGIEWLYRFFAEPKAKWNRVFIEIPLFLAMLIGKKLVPVKYHSLARKVIVQ